VFSKPQLSEPFPAPRRERKEGWGRDKRENITGNPAS